MKDALQQSLQRLRNDVSRLQEQADTFVADELEAAALDILHGGRGRCKTLPFSYQTLGNMLEPLI